VRRVTGDARSAIAKVQTGCADYLASASKRTLPPKWQQARSQVSVTHSAALTGLYQTAYQAERSDRERLETDRKITAGEKHSSLPSGPEVIASLADVEKLRRAELDLQAAEAQLADYQAEQALAERAADAVPTRARVKGVLYVLGYIGCVDVLIPLGLLVQDPSTVDYWLRLLVFALFASGLITMLVYLVHGFRDEIGTGGKSRNHGATPSGGGDGDRTP